MNAHARRIIARLGGIPPRKLVESFGVRFPSADPSAVPELSDTYESNVKGLYIVGALAGYPLIKQAMNQGYEVVESALGRAVEPADEPLLKQRLAGFSRTKSVSQVLDVIQREVPLLAGVNRLQLREFMLESELATPRRGEVLFRRNDYTNSFYMVVAGEVLVEGTRIARGDPIASIGAGVALVTEDRKRSGLRREGRRCPGSRPGVR